METRQEKKRINQKSVYHAISASLLLVSLLLSVLRFRPVFFRTLQAFKDLGLSVAFYFTELLGFEGVITPTVTQIPHDATEVLPFDPAEFKAGLGAFGRLLINKDNALRFLARMGQSLATTAKVLILVIPILLLLFFLIKGAYARTNNDYNEDTRPLRVYKKIEAVTWEKVKYYIKAYARFLSERRLYILAAGLVWAYNLNVVTIIVEAFAYFFYFAVSFDFWHIYTQVAKLAMDLTVALGFLPWWAWAALGWVIFDHVRKSIGLKKLRSFESCNRAFLTLYLGALFLVGKQRAKKTTIITDMALTQEIIFRDAAKEKLAARDKQFPFFPWINVEILYKAGQEKHSLPTLAKHREFIKKLRLHFKHRAFYENGCGQLVLTAYKKLYGYEWDNFIFDYDAARYGLDYNDNLGMVNVFEAIENYIQLYFIYAAPTSLLVGNYAIRTDLTWEDYGNFPVFDGDFFDRKAEEVAAVSKYSHILDFDCLRLGRVFDDSNPNKDGFEVGCVSVTEIAKERGNQNMNTGIHADADECNPKNDLFEVNTKMQGHNSTIDNYTFFRLLLDDQRADSLSADNKDLCDIILIKGVKDAKIVMPGFALEEALYLAATKFFDKIYYKIRKLRGDNTLFVYLLKKLYSPIYNHYLRIYNQYSVYTAMSLAQN